MHFRSYLTLIVNRLHNDDIHTYDEVARALAQCRCDSPSTLAEQVDKKGVVLVASYDKLKCSTVCTELRHLGLLVTTCRAGRVESINVVTNVLVGRILLVS